MTEISLPYGELPQTDFESQYRRVLQAAQCRTQAELAAVLDIRQAFISDARKRRAVPSDRLITLLEKKDINPEWIRAGTGNKVLQASDKTDNDAPVFFTALKRRPLQECTIDELLTEIVRCALKNMV